MEYFKIPTDDYSAEIIERFLKTGDPTELKEHVSMSPESMQDKPVVELFFRLLDGDIQRPQNRPQSTYHLRKDVLEWCIYYRFSGLNQNKTALLVSQKFSKSESTIIKEYLTPYIKERCYLLGITKNELFSDPKHQASISLMAAAMDGKEGVKWG